MTTKLPSFLQKPAARPGAGIFRAARPELIDTPVAPEAAAASPARAAKPKIFKAKPPTVKTAPAKAATRRPVVVEPPEAPPGFRVIPLARLSQGGRWRTEAMRSYPFPVLLWFTRGQGRITVAGVTSGLGAHNAVFLPAHTMHGFEATAQLFGTALFFPRQTDLDLPTEPCHLRFRDAADQAELNLMLDTITREVEGDRPLADKAIAHQAALLAIWLERQLLARGMPETADSAARRLSAAYSSLVERDFSAGRTVAEFAAELGVTPTHLTRSCNVACGRSAHDILADRIFFEARELLRETEVPVKDIAQRLGFASAAYFTRAFQKTTGETPTGFRRRG